MKDENAQRQGKKLIEYLLDNRIFQKDRETIKLLSKCNTEFNYQLDQRLKELDGYYLLGPYYQTFLKSALIAGAYDESIVNVPLTRITDKSKFPAPEELVGFGYDENEDGIEAVPELLNADAYELLSDGEIYPIVVELNINCTATVLREQVKNIYSELKKIQDYYLKRKIEITSQKKVDRICRERLYRQLIDENENVTPKQVVNKLLGFGFKAFDINYYDIKTEFYNVKN